MITPHDNNTMKVFISFSSADKKLAEKIYQRLRARSIDAWISSRDIPPGSDYQSCIVAAIESARAVVLVFSANANASAEIAKELSLASKKIIIPARIEDVPASGALQYQLSNRQFIDLFDDFDRQLDELCDHIGGMLGELDGTQPGPAGGPRRRGRGKSPLVALGAAGLIVVAAGAAWMGGLFGRHASASRKPVAMAAAVLASAPAAGSTHPGAVAARADAPAPTQVAAATPVLASAVAKPSPAAPAPAPSPASATAAAKPAPASAAPPAPDVSGLLSILGNSSQGDRLQMLRDAQSKGQLPFGLHVEQAVKLLNGIDPFRSNGVQLLAPALQSGLDGAQVAAVLGPLGSGDRLDALRSLIQAGRIKQGLSTKGALAILGGTEPFWPNAVALLSPALAGGLDAQDVVSLIGNARNGDCLNVLQSLQQAGKVRQGLSAADVASMVANSDAFRSNAIALVAGDLAGNLHAKDVALILGPLTSGDRLDALRTLVNAGKIAHGMSGAGKALLLQGAGPYRSNMYALLAPY